MHQPLTEYYRELLDSCRAELRTLGYSKTVVKLVGAGEFLRRMEEQGKRQLDQVTAGDVKRHYAYLLERPNLRGGRLSQHTLPGYLYALRLLFDYAERNELIKGNPLAGLKFRRPKGGRKIVAERGEINRLYQACRDDRQRAILHLLYGCGLRLLEAERLNLKDLDYLGGLLYVRRGKGKKRRVVPLGKQVKVELERYAKVSRKIWVTSLSNQAFLLDDRGGRMRKGIIYRRLKELVRAAGVNPRISPHVLRHSIATHLLEQGMSIERVRDFLGHQLLETTQLYTHVKTENP